MRVQLDFDKEQSASAYAFFDEYKQRWEDCEVKQNKEMTRTHLDMDVIITKENKEFMDRNTIQRRVDEVLQYPVFLYYVHDLKIGKPMKCWTCNGTGESYFPGDILADEVE